MLFKMCIYIILIWTCVDAIIFIYRWILLGGWTCAQRWYEKILPAFLPITLPGFFFTGKYYRVWHYHFSFIWNQIYQTNLKNRIKENTDANSKNKSPPPKKKIVEIILLLLIVEELVLVKENYDDYYY